MIERDCQVCGQCFARHASKIKARFCSRACADEGQRQDARSAKQPEDFWRLIQQTDGCWIWPLSKKYGGGYGRARFNGRRLQAHRLAYELAIGPVPEGLYVCHHCDTPACVRPSHLFVGTSRDNYQDARAKGRMTPPSRHGLAKLSPDQVLDIRRDTRAVTLVARDYGVHWRTIGNVRAGRSYRDVIAHGAPA